MKGKRLSSRLTLMYKLVLPLFFALVTLLVWVAAIALFNTPDGVALVVVALFFTGIMLLMLPPMFVQKVSYDETHLYAYNYRNTKTIPLSKVGKLHRWMFYFYKIDYTNSLGQQKVILLLPSFEQRLEALFGTPQDLKQFEAKVKHLRNG